MVRKTQVFLALVFALSAVLSLSASAAEISTDEIYSFTGAEFDAGAEGLLIRAVPESSVCILCMGSRVIRAGDVLTQSDLDRLVLIPCCKETAEAGIEYQPIADGCLGVTQVCAVTLRSSKNEAPTARDLSLETYKNVANKGVLPAEDPEGDVLSYRIEQQPRRGSVELLENGAFVYTPQKNKVGEDRFTFVAEDLAGNVSEPATVTVRILQPLEAQTFSDLAPAEQFPAMWLREQGLYDGTRLADALCFRPAQPVTRGEFLVMTMKLAQMASEPGLPTDVFADQQTAPVWMRAWMSAGFARGIACGSAEDGGLCFRPNEPVTCAEAAAMLARAFGLERVRTVGNLDHAADDETIPVWAQSSVSAMRSAGIALPAEPEQPLTIYDAARLLYDVSRGEKQ